jgi:hypothetical protein
VTGISKNGVQIVSIIYFKNCMDFLGKLCCNNGGSSNPNNPHVKNFFDAECVKYAAENAA